MAKKAKIESVQMTTEVFRGSFPHVFVAHKVEGTKGDPKFSIDMLFPKSQNMKKYQDAVDLVMTRRYGADKKKWVTPEHPCIKDGDKLIEKAIRKQKQPVEAYAGHWVLSARSGNKPAVVDEHKQAIIDTSKVYGGAFYRAQVAFFWYDTQGNEGVSIALNAVQFVRDGESFGRGRVNVDAAFGDDIPDDGANDPANYSSDESNSEAETDAGF